MRANLRNQIKVRLRRRRFRYQLTKRSKNIRARINRKPLACSGDIYAAVPMITPGLVPPLRVVAASRSAPKGRAGSVTSNPEVQI